MPRLGERVRRTLSSGLTGLAGLACAACCVIPVLIAAGVLSGAAWVTAGVWLPGIAVALLALAGGAWWWTLRPRHHHDCTPEDCACT
ncbi:MAG: hypothetical protein ACRDT6_03000 [Micromonosporaceae bacterium]